MKRKKIIAATSPMYEALFGEDTEQSCVSESRFEANDVPIESASNDTSTAVPERRTDFSS